MPLLCLEGYADCISSLLWQHIDHIMSTHGKQIMQAVTLILEGEHNIEVKEQVPFFVSCCLGRIKFKKQLRMLTLLNIPFLFGIMMCCEYFTEISQINNFSTYENAALSHGLLQMCLNLIQNFFLNVGLVERRALYVRAEELNLRQLHGRKGTVGTQEEKEASISPWGKGHSYLLL